MNEPTPELFETLYETKKFDRALKRIEQAVLRFADHSITVTEQLKQRYVERGADPASISVVLNAADSASDTAGWTPPPKRETGEFVVMAHGAIEDRYGHDTIVHAARRSTRRASRPARGLHGPRLERGRAPATDRGVRNRVTSCGSRASSAASA